MPKFVANLETTMGVSGMRFIPIMIEELGQKVPIVLVRQNVDDPSMTHAIVTAFLDMLNTMLDPDVPFSDLEKPLDGELVWHDEGDTIRAQHPYADQAAYYVRRAPGSGYIATIVDGKTQDIRVIERAESAQRCLEACESQLQHYKSAM